MDRVSIDLRNCHGIKRLSKQFDFSTETVYAIYAPNGVMKTSLAQTFQDVVDGTASVDRIFPLRAASRKITDEHGKDITKESIFVVRPYDPGFGHTEKTSTLLVDLKLKMEYDKLLAGIDASKDILLKALREQSKSKKDLEREISAAFTSTEDEFFTALIRIKQELQEQKDTPFADVQYDTIFDDKVLNVIGTDDVKTAIESYVHRYNELLAASTYFKKGTFDYYQAGQIAKSLADNGFFAAKHTLNLNAADRLEIRTQKELEDVIAKEKEAIIKDKELRKKFDKIADLLKKNAPLRDFQAYMLEHEALLPHLTNIKKFKEDIWKSYLKARFDLYSELMTQFDAAETRKKQIEEEAAKQQTQWESVIQIFNERFRVPFKLNIKNRTDVLLGHDAMIELAFTYHDGAENVPIDKPTLLETLSNGERKALYVLNLIFEVEVRRKANQETLMVIDDIADSFDYQNKYAIIHYLKEISQGGLFRQIIMTHNFDFFRTIQSRFVPYPNCLMASRNDAGTVSLAQAKGIKNVFVNDWKPNFFTVPKKKIASIPFIRNLVEYTKGEADPAFATLTSLVHWKADSATITEADLDAIYNDVFTSTGTSANGQRPMIEIIHEEARACLGAGDGMNFENKVVLAIAIRLAADKFMIEAIGDPAFVDAIAANQTQALLAKFISIGGAAGAIKILERVILMTPENIHLNSFMYEPLVDMSDEHLRKLYGDVLSLS